MRSHFYSRTAYRLLDMSTPQCFIDLDEALGALFETPGQAFAAPTTQHAENLCRRMADVEMFAGEVARAANEPDSLRGAILCPSMLVAYLGAAKAFLDANAILLVAVHRLPLAGGQQDFGKGRFWNALRAASPVTYDAYSSSRPVADDVIRWRDAAVHRVSPLVIPHSPGHPSQTDPQDHVLRVVARPDSRLLDVMEGGADTPWMSPTNLHEKWGEAFVELCVLSCDQLLAWAGESGGAS